MKKTIYNKKFKVMLKRGTSNAFRKFYEKYEI